MRFIRSPKKKPSKKELLRRIAENGFLWLAVFILAAGAILYIPAAISAGSTVGTRELPIYSVDTDRKQVALSFDAAWGNEGTRTIMDILRKHNIKCTFFMTGDWVESYPEDVKFISSEGHDLGNHSETHPNMSELSPDEIKSELMSVHSKVKQLTGVEMTLFRPPYGNYDNNVVLTSKECGYYCIQWDVDSLDWKDYGTENIVKTVLNHKNLHNGSIILMHNNAKYTPEALEAIITGLQNQGYELVPISQLIYKDSYHIDQTGRQIHD
ncbi:polysaccharide deacetylase family protein [Lacrimispora sp. NSJ-141]|uniref:Polysaccharide deacetylase family protein n=1 Tax=Lientehia hominis TaxID=2897778 RepID=A0AAP2RKC3_9FIRM|nr:polysaccharide deacetylase family protein [Lientehia hominis]MCD2493069.1 polysaccharide deacetylase family protein [Lientehia hominis]